MKCKNTNKFTLIELIVTILLFVCLLGGFAIVSIIISKPNSQQTHEVKIVQVISDSGEVTATYNNVDYVSIGSGYTRIKMIGGNEEIVVMSGSVREITTTEVTKIENKLLQKYNRF